MECDIIYRATPTSWCLKHIYSGKNNRKMSFGIVNRLLAAWKTKRENKKRHKSWGISTLTGSSLLQDGNQNAPIVSAVICGCRATIWFQNLMTKHGLISLHRFNIYDSRLLHAQILQEETANWRETSTTEASSIHHISLGQNSDDLWRI